MEHDEAFRRYDGEKTSYRWRGGRITTRRDAPNGIWYLAVKSRRMSSAKLSRLASTMERRAAARGQA